MVAHLSFLGLIASIGVIHLAMVAVQYLRSLRGDRSSDEKNQYSGTQQRDDWYVFFHCADLLGKEPSPPASDRTNSGQPVQTTRHQRESSQRPRSRVRL